MAGIFSGHAFSGMGQATASDAEFSSMISSLASRPPSPTAAAIMSGATVGGKVSPAISEIWAAPAPASSNTTLYIVGGVAVVGVLAALFMMSGGRRIASNRRSKRSRR